MILSNQALGVCEFRMEVLGQHCNPSLSVELLEGQHCMFRAKSTQTDTFRYTVSPKQAFSCTASVHVRSTSARSNLTGVGPIRSSLGLYVLWISIAQNHHMLFEVSSICCHNCFLFRSPGMFPVGGMSHAVMGNSQAKRRLEIMSACESASELSPGLIESMSFSHELLLP